MDKIKCCIIGGGIGGLLSAWELLNHQVYLAHEILIIERLPALGGRMRAKCFSNGTVLNMGAGRFSTQDHPLLTKLIDRLSIKLKAHTIMKISDRAEELNKKYLLILDKAKSINKSWHEISFSSFVIKHFGVDFFQELRIDSGYDTLGQVALPLSEGLRIIAQHPESDQQGETTWFEPVDGFISIIDQIASQLIARGVRIQTECTVKSIALQKSIYTVHCKNRYQNFKISVEKIIIACGKKAIDRIHHPFLTLHRLKNQIQIVPLFKCFMRFDHAWWDEQLNIKNHDHKQLVVLPDCLRKVYFSNDLNMLWVYNDDAAAQFLGERFAECGKDTIQNCILEYLADSFGLDRKKIPDPEETQVFYWSEGVSFWRVGCDPQLANYTALFDIAPNIHVVTDMFAQRSGWVEGVLENVNLLIDSIMYQSEIFEQKAG